LLDQFVHDFADDNYAVTRLKQLSASYATVEPGFVQVTVSTDRPANAVRQCQTTAQEIGSAVSEVKDSTQTSELFDELKQLIGVTDRTASTLNSTPLPDVSRYLTHFKDVYDVYIAKQSVDNAARVLFAGHQAYTTLTALRETASAMANALAVDATLRSGEDRLRLTIDDDSDLQKLADRIDALCRLYEQLCELTGTSHHKYPLRIVKVETGSTEIDVIGAAGPLGVLAILIFRAVQILFRRYVVEGQIEAEAAKRDQITQTLDLRNELQRAGFDTAGLDDRIAAMSESHFANLNQLLYGASVVEVNGNRMEQPEPRGHLTHTSEPEGIEFREDDCIDGECSPTDEANDDDDESVD